MSRDAFAGFCDALFNQELREATVDRLRRAGVLGPGAGPPADRTGRVALVRQAPPECLLELIYRFQFISDDRDYEIVSSYVNNAPLINQFVHEFIQNAEDAGAGVCRFVFENDRVLVVNDGHGFSHENLYAVCSFRESDKASQQRGLQIGKFGVGFKSVFRMTNSPLVVTWDESSVTPIAFRFFVPGAFDREYHSRLEAQWPFHYSPKLPESERPGFASRIGYLFPVPVPLEGDIRATWEEHRRGAARGSMFWLPLRPDLTHEQREKIFDQVEPESFLFLRMQELEVEDRRGKRCQVRGWSKHRSLLSPGGAIELLEVHEYRDDTAAEPVGAALCLDSGPIAVPRKEVQSLDPLVRAALPDVVRILVVTELDGEELRDPGPNGSQLKGKLFNGLPVPGVTTGLNALIDAPFNLSADRTNILDDAYNEWLIRMTGEVMCQFLAVLVGEERFRNQAFRLVPADLGYGRQKGVAELTQRFARTHDQIRAESRRVGVLPALDGGTPLRVGEALGLRGSDASKPKVSRAIQSLIGGELIGVFAKILVKPQADHIRLCRLPEDSHVAAVATVLDQKAFFSPSWMKAALADPGWHARVRERGTQWYADLFTYVAGGIVSDSLEHFLDIAWVPGLAHDARITPREARLLAAERDEELAIIEKGLSAAGGAATTWRFASSAFVVAYEQALSTATKSEAQRLTRLFDGRQIGWIEVANQLVVLLERAQAGVSSTAPTETPDAIWKLLDLLDRNVTLSPDDTAKLGRLINVRVTVEGQTGGAVEVWPAADVMLKPAAELCPVPDQIARHLPHLVGNFSDGQLHIVEQLAARVPTPKLVGAALDGIEAATQDTVAWILKLARLWERTRKPPEIRRALGAMRVAGKYSGEFRPIGSLCRDGFGKSWRHLEERLTQLFGPKTLDPTDYANGLDGAGVRQLQQLADEHPFLPTAAELAHALQRLSNAGDDERRVALATDLAEFLAGVWEHYPHDPHRRAERLELSNLLRDTEWVPATVAGGRARPGDLVLEQRELLDLLGDAVQGPLLPSGVEAGERWTQTLRFLSDRTGVRFQTAEALGRKAGQALAAGLRREFADQTAVLKRLERIGRFLEHDWFKREAAGLRETIDLAAAFPGKPLPPAVLWLVCESAEREAMLVAEYPRGVAVVHHPKLPVRRAVIWASQGIDASKGTSLESAEFALRLTRMLGRSDGGPLEERERTTVVRAYQRLARERAGEVWFKPDELTILAASGRLVASGSAVYTGENSVVVDALTKHLPDHLLASEVRSVDRQELPNILKGLGLDAAQPSEQWVQITDVPVGAQRNHTVSPQVRPNVPAAVRALVPRAPADPGLDRLAIRVVDSIERRIAFPAVAGRVAIEAVDVYLQQRPAVLFLTAAGREKFDGQLLRLVNTALYEEQQKQDQSRRDAWAKARTLVEELAAEQKTCLLYNYHLTSHDAEFRKSDQDLDRRQRGLEERWKNFLADRKRIGLVVKKCTTDIGYGKETIARELLQNVDDAYHGVVNPPDQPAWVEFRQHDRALVVSHGGRRFDHEDLVRICGLGGSGKSALQIGRFGLGFKSVLGVAPEPIILSHPYCIRIKHVVVPEWLDPADAEQRGWHVWQHNHAVTRFVLEGAAGDDAVDALVERFVYADPRTGDLAPRALLFLNNLREVRLRTKKGDRTVTRTDVASPVNLLITPTAPFDDVQISLRRLELREEGRQPLVEEFLVIVGRVKVPVPTERGTETRPLRCGLAIPWDTANGRPGPPLAGDSQLHMFLPTRTRTGLPFLVNGEFLTTLGRVDIDGEQQPNALLSQQIGALVQATLVAAFHQWREDPEGLRAWIRVAPSPAGDSLGAGWLGPIRRAYAALIKGDQPVVLTADGTLKRPSDCVLAQRLAREARGALLAADPSCPLDPFVDAEIETEIARAAEGKVRSLNGPEFVRSLFPIGLKREKTVKRVRAILRALHTLSSGADLSQQTEVYHAFNQLSRVPCMPDAQGGVACPDALHHPDLPVSNSPPHLRADLGAIVADDPKFRRWVIDRLDWAGPPETQAPPPPAASEWYGVMVTAEDRRRLWAHNLKLISAWWSSLPAPERQKTTDRYGLTGDQLWPILGLGDSSGTRRADHLQEALREGGPDHERVWFRLLCLANVAQSGRRFKDGVEFLRRFDTEFHGFDRLWNADANDRGDAVSDLIHEAVGAYIKDRASAEQAWFWRRVYDFVKIRTLIQRRQLLDGFWDAVDNQPASLAEYLSRGQAPGCRFPHRGLGESLSSQAFFLCRECFRLGIIRADPARESCYAPNRHLTRFVRRLYGPDPGDWPEFKHYQAWSHQLHLDVNAAGTRDFDGAFDLPLFHLALHDEPTRLVPGLLVDNDLPRVREFLNPHP